MDIEVSRALAVGGKPKLKIFHAATVTNRRRIFIAAIKNNEGE